MIELTHLHPMIVHFPIALILAGFLADTLYYFYKNESWLPYTGFWLMVLGTVAALSAFLTGALFSSPLTEGEVAHLYIIHKTGGFTTTIIMIAASVIRVRRAIRQKELKADRTVYILYTAGAVAVSFTGYIGGTMVYSYLLGI